MCGPATFIARCIDVMTEAARRRGGAPIRTIGDEILTAFSSVAAAREMEDRITGTITVKGRPLAIRIGFHFGMLLLEETDVYGDAVNLAARVAVLAKPGQILTTGATVAAMIEAERKLCRQIDLVQVKGKLEPISIFELLWRSDGDTTLMLAPWTTRRQPVGKLILIVDNQWCELSETHPSRVGAGIDRRFWRGAVLRAETARGRRVEGVDGWEDWPQTVR